MCNPHKPPFSPKTTYWGFKHGVWTLSSPRQCNLHGPPLHYIEAYTWWTLVFGCHDRTKIDWLPFKMNYPPLSDRNVLILCSDCIFTNVFDSFKNLNILPFEFSTHTIDICLEKTSMKVPKYLAPSMGRHTSECTISTGLFVCLSLLFGNATLYYFSLMWGKKIYQNCIIHHVFRTYKTPFTFKSPRRWCQVLSTLSPVYVCTKLVASALCTFAIGFVQVIFAWYKRNGFIVIRFQNAFV